MKRITYWPQAWLGIAMNFGIVVAWVATTGTVDLELLSVLMVGTWGYVISMCRLIPEVKLLLSRWTMHYDTIYACQDRKDDIVVGVKSTAVMLGDFVRPFTAACAALFLATLYYAGRLNDQTPIFFLLTVGGTAAHVLYQYATVDLDSPDSCGSK
jgi:4-hydroxybenzoate polyprenyltransferase